MSDTETTKVKTYRKGTPIEIPTKRPTPYTPFMVNMDKDERAELYKIFMEEIVAHLSDPAYPDNSAEYLLVNNRANYETLERMLTSVSLRFEVLGLIKRSYPTMRELLEHHPYVQLNPLTGELRQRISAMSSDLVPKGYALVGEAGLTNGASARLVDLHTFLTVNLCVMFDLRCGGHIRFIAELGQVSGDQLQSTLQLKLWPPNVTLSDVSQSAMMMSCIYKQARATIITAQKAEAYVHWMQCAALNSMSILYGFPAFAQLPPCPTKPARVPLLNVSYHDSLMALVRNLAWSCVSLVNSQRLVIGETLTGVTNFWKKAIQEVKEQAWDTQTLDESLRTREAYLREFPIVAEAVYAWEQLQRQATEDFVLWNLERGHLYQQLSADLKDMNTPWHERSTDASVRDAYALKDKAEAGQQYLRQRETRYGGVTQHFLEFGTQEGVDGAHLHVNRGEWGLYTAWLFEQGFLY